jgi:putative restriction endonuclease
VSKAIFTTKAEPTYHDLPEFRYHFPRTYLRQVEATVGDWIIYYEPRRSSGDLGSRGGRKAYFAAARVTAVRPDARNSDHFYAFISDFLQFDRPVPFKEREHYYEASLQRPDGQTSKGAFGRAGGWSSGSAPAGCRRNSMRSSARLLPRAAGRRTNI